MYNLESALHPQMQPTIDHVVLIFIIEKCLHLSGPTHAVMQFKPSLYSVENTSMEIKDVIRRNLEYNLGRKDQNT